MEPLPLLGGDISNPAPEFRQCSSVDKLLLSAIWFWILKNPKISVLLLKPEQDRPLIISEHLQTTLGRSVSRDQATKKARGAEYKPVLAEDNHGGCCKPWCWTNEQCQLELDQLEHWHKSKHSPKPGAKTKPPTVAESTCKRGLVYKAAVGKSGRSAKGLLVCFCFFPHLLLRLVGPFGQGWLSVKALGFLAPRICLTSPLLLLLLNKILNISFPVTKTRGTAHNVPAPAVHAASALLRSLFSADTILTTVFIFAIRPSMELCSMSTLHLYSYAMQRCSIWTVTENPK